MSWIAVRNSCVEMHVNIAKHSAHSIVSENESTVIRLQNIYDT